MCYMSLKVSFIILSKGCNVFLFIDSSYIIWSQRYLWSTQYIVSIHTQIWYRHKPTHTQINTHTHIYTDIYLYIYVCVCSGACMCVCLSVCVEREIIFIVYSYCTRIKVTKRCMILQPSICMIVYWSSYYEGYKICICH